MYRNIVICGNIGTGTTTLAKNLATKLSWEHVSTGDIYRAQVIKDNIPLWDHASFPDELDKQIDSYFLEKVSKEKNIVFDTHYGGWLSRNLNDVLRILLICNPKIAASRVITREHTHKETEEEIEKRRKGNQEKFKKLYSDENYEDPKFFNVVIDTGISSEEQTLQTALDFFNKS